MVLIVNFPVAAGIVYAADAISSRYVVTIRNDSLKNLEQIRLSGGGCEELIARIAPADSTERSVWCKADGEFRFDALLGESRRSAMIEVYVSNGTGGRADIVIMSDGQVRVRKFDRRGRLVPEGPSVSVEPLSEK